MSEQISKPQIIIASLALVLITLVTAYFALNSRHVPESFFVRSIEDASYNCEDKIDSYMGDRLISKYYDNYSSRYEPEDRQYLIYYRVTARDEVDGTPIIRDYMAKCNVWERLGYVSGFKVFDKF